MPRFRLRLAIKHHIWIGSSTLVIVQILVLSKVIMLEAREAGPAFTAFTALLHFLHVHMHHSCIFAQ